MIQLKCNVIALVPTASNNLLLPPLHDVAPCGDEPGGGAGDWYDQVHHRKMCLVGYSCVYSSEKEARIIKELLGANKYDKTVRPGTGNSTGNYDSCWHAIACIIIVVFDKSKHHQ